MRPMIQNPSYIVFLDSLPIGDNGDIDIDALPKPDIDSPAVYVAPRDEIEAAICDALSAVIGVERVGIDDDLFAIGLSVPKIVRLGMMLGEDLDIKQLNISIEDVLALRSVRLLVTKAMLLME